MIILNFIKKIFNYFLNLKLFIYVIFIDYFISLINYFNAELIDYLILFEHYLYFPIY
jgi:hypothetical protein